MRRLGSFFSLPTLLRALNLMAVTRRMGASFHVMERGFHDEVKADREMERHFHSAGIAYRDVVSDSHDVVGTCHSVVIGFYEMVRAYRHVVINDRDVASHDHHAKTWIFMAVWAVG